MERLVRDLVYLSPDLFPAPHEFRPERLLEGRGAAYSWIPFGGGRRRCPAATFATSRIRVALRTIFRHVALRPDRQAG